ncbi:MAG: glycerol-3-phosphate dehydrogenase/oxidase [Sneathiella sp.]|uniref:glycerol-3-phosphate dehydrogenase/oxidase n=1 Tax=Sneathiella sp. TaxID=1964365 RepID=UPI0030026464
MHKNSTIAEVFKLTSGQPLADRESNRDRMAGSEVDVLVVGGGITGAGVALDAATRGLSVALVEMDDFASGTSSRSSKMIHGGFRYLQTGDVALVRESLRERYRLQRNAPHLVSLLPFMIPLFLKGGFINPKLSRALGGALWSYQFAGAWRLGKRHQRLSRDQVQAHMPSLDMNRIGGGYIFYDLRADDVRLTLAVLASAVENGATILNYASCDQISDFYDGGRVATINTDGNQFTVRARVIVNATGIWSDKFVQRSGLQTEQQLAPAKGAHLVVRSDALRNDVAVSIPIASDKRTVSVVDAGHFSYIGSTEANEPADINHPTVTDFDIDYILTGLNKHLTTPLKACDLTGGWAGFRPLLANDNKSRSSDLSRKHQISKDGEGFISVMGGKLTTYREMSEHTVDIVGEILGLKRPCMTRKLKLHGHYTSASHIKGGERLEKRYGNRAALIKKMVSVDPALGQCVTPNDETLLAEIIWGLHAEMGCNLSDVLLRRTRVGLYDGRALLSNIDEISSSIMDWTNWSAARRAIELGKTKTVLRSELGVLANHLPEPMNNETSKG